MDTTISKLLIQLMKFKIGLLKFAFNFEVCIHYNGQKLTIKSFHVYCRCLLKLYKYFIFSKKFTKS